MIFYSVYGNLHVRLINCEISSKITELTIDPRSKNQNYVPKLSKLNLK